MPSWQCYLCPFLSLISFPLSQELKMLVISIFLALEYLWWLSVFFGPNFCILRQPLLSISFARFPWISFLVLTSAPVFVMCFFMTNLSSCISYGNFFILSYLTIWLDIKLKVQDHFIQFLQFLVYYPLVSKVTMKKSDFHIIIDLLFSGNFLHFLLSYP